MRDGIYTTKLPVIYMYCCISIFYMRDFYLSTRWVIFLQYLALSLWELIFRIITFNPLYQFHTPPMLSVPPVAHLLPSEVSDMSNLISDYPPPPTVSLPNIVNLTVSSNLQPRLSESIHDPHSFSNYERPNQLARVTTGFLFFLFFFYL